MPWAARINGRGTVNAVPRLTISARPKQAMPANTWAASARVSGTRRSGVD